MPATAPGAGSEATLVGPRADLRATEIATNLHSVRQRIQSACEQVGRDPGSVTLIVVTKHHPADDVACLRRLGVLDVGENREQEASAKVTELGTRGAGVRWHFIGQLQTNKAARVAAFADTVHSVDRVPLVRALQRGAAAADRDLGVTIQVALSGNGAGRGGCGPAALQDIIDACRESDRLRLRGVMGVAPIDVAPARAFAELARVSGIVRASVPGADWISAGMSGDLEAAIAAGATHVRVGTAILGDRRLGD